MDCGLILKHTSNETHEWNDIVESEALESLLLERNTAHLSQSTDDGTPFAVAPLNDLVGMYGTNEVAGKLLEGNLDVSTLPLTNEAKEWLRQLRREEDCINDIDVTITPEQFQRMAANCNPNTAAS